VSGAQAGETGGLVAATRLDTDETVLNLSSVSDGIHNVHCRAYNVDTANTVTAGNGVGSQEQLNGIGGSLLLATLGVLKLDGNTLLEGQGEILGLVGSGQGVLSELPHVGGRGGVGVLQDTGLVGAVGQVLIHRPGLGLGRGDGDTLLLGVVEQVLATLEALVEDGFAPWGNNLDVGLESVEGKLEADLVVTLTSAAVGDGEAALALGNLDLGTGNDGTGQGGTEKVDVLVDGIASNGGEAELLDELTADVDNLALEGTDLQGLLAGSLEVL
jgi:hypothetical protein